MRIYIKHHFFWKLISLLTCFAFVFYTTTCYTEKSLYTLQDINRYKSIKKNVEVKQVLKKSGDLIYFHEKYPGRITYSGIVGSPQVHIDYGAQDSLIFDPVNGKVIKLIMDDGKRYTVISTDEKGLLCIDSEMESVIPISQVDQVLVRSYIPGATYILIVVSTVVVSAIVIGSFAPSPPPPPPSSSSCPYIYSFNGEEFVLDAEPYGNAICRGFERTDFSKMEHLTEEDSLFKILISNERDESQYINEMVLWAVDHPSDLEVVADDNGNLYAISSPQSPVVAYDINKENICSSLSKRDMIYWHESINKINLDYPEYLKDELVVKFVKPSGVRHANLIINAGNTQWASYIYKQYLELHGTEINSYYAKLNSYGLSNPNVMNWSLSEELNYLQIRTRTNTGWKSNGLISGGNTMITENKVFPLDLSHITGDTLEIKLTPPLLFWKIDYMAVDYSTEIPLEKQVLYPTSALYDGKEIKDLITYNDEEYLIIPEKGKFIEVDFDAPPVKEGLDRTIILKSTGYYKKHLESKGKPDKSFIAKFWQEPGFTIKYSLKEYKKLEEEYMSKMGK